MDLSRLFGWAECSYYRVPLESKLEEYIREQAR